MTLLVFLGALAASVMAVELLEALLGLRLVPRGRLLHAEDLRRFQAEERLGTWQALLAALWPSRFHPRQARNREDVVERLRRAGYPFESTGAFYAYAIRTFGFYTVLGLLAAGFGFMSGVPPLLALFPFAAFVVIGLRRPYTRLKRLTRERAEAMRLNMLPVMSAFLAYLRAGVNVQSALQGCERIGGPFGNLLGFLAARMQVEPFERAIERTRAHLPDPNDQVAVRFFDAVEAYFTRNRPMLDTVDGLLKDLKGEHADETAERVALTKRQAGLFGVLAVVGLLITLIWPTFG